MSAEPTVKDLRLLRTAVWAEGQTLLVLLLVAVPAKWLFDLPVATKIMGPVHGVAFLFFTYALIEAMAARYLHAGMAIRLFVGALIPFGGLVNQRWLKTHAKLVGEES